MGELNRGGRGERGGEYSGESEITETDVLNDSFYRCTPRKISAELSHTNGSRAQLAATTRDKKAFSSASALSSMFIRHFDDRFSPGVGGTLPYAGIGYYEDELVFPPVDRPLLLVMRMTARVFRFSFGGWAGLLILPTSGRF